MLHRYITMFSFSILILLYRIKLLTLSVYYSRRILSDDGRGVGEPLDEEVCVIENNNSTCEGLTVCQCHQLVYIFMHSLCFPLFCLHIAYRFFITIFCHLILHRLEEITISASTMSELVRGGAVQLVRKFTHHSYWLLHMRYGRLNCWY
jgi:hypothetical protein